MYDSENKRLQHLVISLDTWTGSFLGDSTLWVLQIGWVTHLIRIIVSYFCQYSVKNWKYSSEQDAMSVFLEFIAIAGTGT